MKNKVLIMALVFLLCSVVQGKSKEDLFFFQGEIYQNNSVKLTDFSLRKGFPDDFVDTERGLKHPNAYEFRLVTKRGEVIFSGVGLVSFTIYVEPVNLTAVNGSDIITLEKNEVFLKIPYYSSADLLQIFRKGKVVYSLNISHEICIKDAKCPDYCKGRKDPDCEVPLTTTSIILNPLCGNGVCNKEESYRSCPKDCPSGVKDDYCDKVRDGRCDLDCSVKEDPDCEGEGFSLLLYVFIALIVLGGILITLWVKREKIKNKRRKEELKEWVRKKREQRLRKEEK